MLAADAVGEPTGTLLQPPAPDLPLDVRVGHARCIRGRPGDADGGRLLAGLARDSDRHLGRADFGWLVIVDDRRTVAHHLERVHDLAQPVRWRLKSGYERDLALARMTHRHLSRISAVEVDCIDGSEREHQRGHLGQSHAVDESMLPLSVASMTRLPSARIPTADRGW